MSRITIFGGIAAATIACAPLSAASAVTVSVFNDPAFVDADDEGTHMLGDIAALGHTANVFTGTTAGDWLAGIGGNSVLILPEMEVDDLVTGIDAAALDVISDFVMAGGTLIQANYFSSNVAVPNTLFGYSIVDGASAGATSLTADAAGTSFASGPITLLNANAVEGVLTSSLPAGALSIYDDNAGTTFVFATSVGAGSYIYLGYDWFQEESPVDWVAVLDNAINFGGAIDVPAPGALGLLGLGTLVLAGARRRRG